jgi:hemerythrin
MGISWREELSLGVDQIDNQHKELLARFDMLLTACKQGKGGEEVLYLLNFLDEYVVVHFGDEEKLQKQSRFPDYESHRLEHQSFIDKLADLKKRIADEGVQIDLVLDTNKLLLDWLIRHISIRDKAVGKHLRGT